MCSCRQHRCQWVNAHTCTVNELGWKYGLIHVGYPRMYKIQSKVIQWQHYVVAMVVFSEYVLHHISHDGSMIRWYILLWFSRKQNEYRVHLENQFLHLSFRSCTFSYSLPEGQVQKLVFFAYTSLIIILSSPLQVS